jgi:septum formation protein
MSQSSLILASTSPYRRDLLARLGVPFRAVAPACDEDALKDPTLTPRALAEHLAEAKARSIADQEPHATVIGSDQVAALQIDGGWRILGKPGTAERAIDQLALLSGRTHLLITAMVVVHAGRAYRHTDQTRLTMRALNRDQLARYVATDQPLNCAGAYKLEAQGVALFARIASDDHSAITGLPLMALTRILGECGYPVP